MSDYYKDAIEATGGRARDVFKRAYDATRFLKAERRLDEQTRIEWLAMSPLISGTPGRSLGQDKYVSVAELDLAHQPGLHRHGYIVKTFNIENDAAADVAVSSLAMTHDKKLQQLIIPARGVYAPTDDSVRIYFERAPILGDVLLNSIRKGLKKEQVDPQDLLSMVYMIQEFVNVNNELWNADYRYADNKWENFAFDIIQNGIGDRYDGKIIDNGGLEPRGKWREKMERAGIPTSSARALNPYYSPERMVKAIRMRDAMLADKAFDLATRQRIIDNLDDLFDMRDEDVAHTEALAIADATDGIYDSIRAHPEAYMDDLYGAVLMAREPLERGVTIPIHDHLAPLAKVIRKTLEEHTTPDRLKRAIEPAVMEAKMYAIEQLGMQAPAGGHESRYSFVAHRPEDEQKERLNKTVTIPRKTEVTEAYNPNKTVMVEPYNPNKTITVSPSFVVPAENIIDPNKTRTIEQLHPKASATAKRPNKTVTVPKRKQ